MASKRLRPLHLWIRKRRRPAPALQIKNADGSVTDDGDAQNGFDVGRLNAWTVAKARVQDRGRTANDVPQREGFRDDALRDDRPDDFHLLIRTASRAPRSGPL